MPSLAAVLRITIGELRRQRDGAVATVAQQSPYVVSRLRSCKA